MFRASLGSVPLSKAVTEPVADSQIRTVPSAAELAAADQLGNELDSVRADARSALTFLAAKFLPAGREAGPVQNRSLSVTPRPMVVWLQS